MQGLPFTKASGKARLCLHQSFAQAVSLAYHTSRRCACAGQALFSALTSVRTVDMSYAKCARRAALRPPPGRTWELTRNGGRSFCPESGLLFATLAECCPQVEVLVLSHSNVEEEVACLAALPKLRVTAPPAADWPPGPARLSCVPRAITPAGRSCL